MKSENPEIDLLELTRQLWAKRIYILKVTAVAMIVGFVMAISIPREYTCMVKMAPEGPRSSLMGNMSNLAAIAGINLDVSNSNDLNLAVYPDVVQSMPFLAKLLQVELKNRESTQGITLYTYLEKRTRQTWWRTVLASPFKLVDIILHRKKSGSDKEINPYNLTIKQNNVFKSLKKRISVAINKKTGTITAGVTMQDPVVAAIVADTLVAKLERFVIDYRTNKSKNDFDFATEMFTAAMQKYYESQKNYARYMDEHRNIALESEKIEQERLKNEKDLAFNVYSMLAQQVETARLKVQEQTPSVTIIEPARVPVEKSNTSRLTILLVFVFLGILVGAIKVIYSNWNKIQINE